MNVDDVKKTAEGLAGPGASWTRRWRARYGNQFSRRGPGCGHCDHGWHARRQRRCDSWAGRQTCRVGAQV